MKTNLLRRVLDVDVLEGPGHRDLHHLGLLDTTVGSFSVPVEGSLAIEGLTISFEGYVLA